jgi:hypothetical protein
MKDRRHVFELLLGFVVVSSDIWFIWRVRFFPSVDYPAWLYQGLVFSRYLQKQAVPGYALKHYPIPNAISTVILGVLDLWFRAETSGKILLSLSVTLFVLGAIYLLAWRTERYAGEAVCAVSLGYALSAHVFRGNLNYVIAVGLMCLYLGYVSRRWSTANAATVLMSALFLILIFVAHLLPYVVAVVATFFIALVSDRPTAAIKRTIIVSAPSLGLLAWYALARRAAHEVVLRVNPWQGWSFKFLESRFAEAVSLFQRFPPWQGRPTISLSVFAVADMLLCGAAAVLCCSPMLLIGRRDKSIPRYDRALLMAGLVCTIVFVGAPVNFGDVWAPGGRFLIPGCLLVLGPVMRYGSEKYGNPVRLIACLILILQATYLQLRVSQASEGLEGAFENLSATTSREEFCKIYRAELDQTWPVGRQSLYQRMPYVMPLVVELPYYFYFERESPSAAPGFSTGILRFRSGTPLEKTRMFCTDDEFSVPASVWKQESTEEPAGRLLRLQ